MPHLHVEFSEPRMHSIPSKHDEQSLRKLRQLGVFSFESTIKTLLNKRNTLEERIKSIVVEFSIDRGWRDEKTESVAVLALRDMKDKADCYGRYDKPILIHDAVLHAIAQQPHSLSEITRFIQIWSMIMVLLKQKRHKKTVKRNKN